MAQKDLNKRLNKEAEEIKYKELLKDMIQNEDYLGVYILLGEKLRKQAKEDSLIEDKRTEGIN